MTFQELADEYEQHMSVIPVQFTRAIEEQEAYAEYGMRGDILRVTTKEKTNFTCVIVRVAYTLYRGNNALLETPNYTSDDGLKTATEAGKAVDFEDLYFEGREDIEKYFVIRRFPINTGFTPTLTNR